MRHHDEEPLGPARDSLRHRVRAPGGTPGSAGPAPDQAKGSDPWQAIRGLLGSWEGDAKGEPGSGKCEREYRLILRDKFIQVTNRSTYPPQEKNPKGEVHEDTGFISYDKAAQKLVMRQFHIEGFVNHYVLDNVSEDGRRWCSLRSPSRTYRRAGAGKRPMTS